MCNSYFLFYDTGMLVKKEEISKRTRASSLVYTSDSLKILCMLYDELKLSGSFFLKMYGSTKIHKPLILLRPIVPSMHFSLNSSLNQFHSAMQYSCSFLPNNGFTPTHILNIIKRCMELLLSQIHHVQ